MDAAWSLADGNLLLLMLDLQKSFGSTDFLKVYDQLLNCLNIRKIEVTGTKKTKVEYNYYLDDDNWKQLQIKELKKGYESHSLRQVGKQVH